MKKITPRKIKRALKELGNTSTEVASTLKELNIGGFPRDGSHCPIANYLRQKFDAHGFVAASRKSVTVSAGGGNWIVADTTPAVYEFIQQYDQSFGRYGL